MPHNPYRGEVEATLGGHPYRLRLTLGALAELEAALGAESLPALLERFEQGRFSARDIIAVITAGLHGAGHTDITQQQVAHMSHAEGVHGMVQLVAKLLAAAFPATDEPPAQDAAPAPDNAAGQGT